MTDSLNVYFLWIYFQIILIIIMIIIVIIRNIAIVKIKKHSFLPVHLVCVFTLFVLFCIWPYGGFVAHVPVDTSFRL